MIELHDLYRRLGRNVPVRQVAYQQPFKSLVGGANLEAIRNKHQTGWVSGNDRFRQGIEKLSGTRSQTRFSLDGGEPESTTWG